MKNKKDIELMVSDLTEAEKNLILKIGKYYILAFILVALPVFAYVVYNIVRVLDVAKNHMIADRLFRNNLIALGGFLVYTIVSLVFVKLKFPFYSDKKYKYLKKNKKGEF